MKIRSASVVVAAFLSLSTALIAQSIPPAVKAAEASIDGEKIRAQVRFLSDDLLEGRGPGLRGSEIAAKYIATQFALYGLKPGGDNGTFLQQINFVGMKVIPEKTTMSLIPKKPAGMSIDLHSIDLTYAEDYTVSNRMLTPSVDIDAPIVFVGYGAIAPEFQWDDYAGVDVKGKVILCIVGDPPSTDPSFFGGDALTYYGRWTYKFEEAARKGAVGALIIHRTDLASYGWDVVKNSNTSEKTYLRDDKNPQLEAASWIQLDVAKKIFAASGLDADAEIVAAGKRGFKAVELPVRLQAHVESTVRPFQSPNVVGILPGANAGGKDQAVMYTAHYDHLGFVAGMAGDNIYNGAADNGTGCGMLLEMARAWAESGVKLPHSIVFASVTAEEQGLLGSEYLGQHPPIPAGQIALDINYDMILPIGVPLETNVNGAQRTTFYPTVEATAKRFNLAIVPDPKPSAGSYYRSDHFSLSRVGIPAFSIETGNLYEGHDAAWGHKQHEEFTEHDYHNFSDNFHEDWDFSGNAKLDRFGMELGWEALSAPAMIQWKAKDEFEAARKASQGEVDRAKVRPENLSRNCPAGFSLRVSRSRRSLESSRRFGR
ncbi:M20/M25/M40 family metallo-hydrolase [Tunturiibacter empetritectus]|uniref:Zn-dependent M28 family amino/carboxypeptidase n=1 Tax=Tunturiibacter lichenicola TaxID=2051959 RepID=A0A852VK25_9BACT|nr:M28 family peptidase [Edaphobacter lichenicola]NYF91990.1 Zn-dependent M28 family amino/carboxypeptidase [Edaphobacter lichenicola]